MEHGRRQLTARERKDLEALVSVWTQAMRAVLLLVAVGTVGLFLRAVQAGLASLELPVWAVGAAACGAWLYTRAGAWTGGSALRRQVKSDLRSGEMAVKRLQVVDALLAPEVEDEGPTIFVREAGGSILFFSGQETGRRRSRGFPWTEFEASWAPESKQLFRVRSLGRPFEPVVVRSPLSVYETKQLGLLESEFGVVEEDWAELKRDASGG